MIQIIKYNDNNTVSKITLEKDKFIFIDKSEYEEIFMQGDLLEIKVKEIKYVFECTGFELNIRKDNFIKNIIRKLVIKYLNF